MMGYCIFILLLLGPIGNAITFTDSEVKCQFSSSDPNPTEIKSLYWFHVPKNGLDFGRDINSAANVTDLKKVKEKQDMIKLAAVKDMDSKQIIRREKAEFWNNNHLSFGAKACIDIPYYGYPESLSPKCDNAIGFFREPSQRLISMYYHSKTLYPMFPKDAIDIHSEKLALKWGLGRRLEAMLNISSNEINSFQTKMLLYDTYGIGILHKPMVLNANAMVEAIKRLQTFRFIGLTSQWYPSICLFRIMTRDNKPYPVSSFWRKDTVSVHKVHVGAAHFAVNERKKHAKSDNVDTSDYSIHNPRCEELSFEEEKLCAVDLSQSNGEGKIKYRTLDLVPNYVDCPDEIIYRAAQIRQFEMVKNVISVDEHVTISHELIVPPILEELPIACKDLFDEVMILLESMNLSRLLILSKTINTAV